MTREHSDNTREGSAAARTLDISNVVAAFSEEQIERMLGLTKSRLRYWARTGFFKPSFAEEDKYLPYSRFYSFKDVVALRTLERLRVQNGVPLQHLRKVAEKLSHLDDDLWVKTTLFVVGKTVVVVTPGTGRPRETVSGQFLLALPLAKVIADTEEDVVAWRRRPRNSQGKISRNRAVARNAWVVSGTRIPVSSIIRLNEDGYSPEDIIAEYPDLTGDDIRAALSHDGEVAA